MKEYSVSTSRKNIIQLKLQRIRDSLNNPTIQEEVVYELIMDSVFVLEQAIKIQLANINYLLIYKQLPKANDVKKILEFENLEGIHTIAAREGLMFLGNLLPDSEIVKNSKVATQLITHRGNIYHHILQIDEVSNSDLLGLVRNIFNALLLDLKPFIGTLPDPEPTNKVFTKEQVDKLFRDSVRRKLQLGARNPHSLYPMEDWSSYRNSLEPPFDHFSSYWGLQCPRCGLSSFKLVSTDPYMMSTVYSTASVLGARADISEQFYQCSGCHLELTPEEFEEAKKIRLGE